MPWCKFFIPKIASPDIKPGDPELNDHVMYAKCIKGHVLRDAEDWILCENLPSPDAKCWQEGGDTLFSLAYKRKEAKEAKEAKAVSEDTLAEPESALPQRTTS